MVGRAFRQPVTKRHKLPPPCQVYTSSVLRLPLVFCMRTMANETFLTRKSSYPACGLISKYDAPIDTATYTAPEYLKHVDSPQKVHDRRSKYTHYYLIFSLGEWVGGHVRKHIFCLFPPISRHRTGRQLCYPPNTTTTTRARPFPPHTPRKIKAPRALPLWSEGQMLRSTAPLPDDTLQSAAVFQMCYS